MKYGAYGMDHLALAPADGSGLRSASKATEDLDRGIGAPRFSPDGKWLRLSSSTIARPTWNKCSGRRENRCRRRSSFESEFCGGT